MKLKVGEAEEYPFTSEVILRTESADFWEGDVLKLQNPRVPNKFCGAIVAKVQKGNEEIMIGKHLQENLSVKLGDVVHAEKIEPPDASEVELLVPDKEITEDIIMEHLEGRPINSGEKIPIIIYMEKKIIQVANTKPTGIVMATKSTKLRIPVRSSISEKLIQEETSTKDIQVEIPQVSFEDIGGLDDVKEFLKENIVEGIKNPGIFEEYGTKPKKCILLYGPPGTGKTFLAYAVANECDAKFISIRGPELKTMWYGETERKIRSKFSEALENAPCILFFDEFDAIQRREILQTDSSVVTQVNTEIDQIDNSSKNVFLIATTNRPDLIDPAIIRRFKCIEVKLPNKEARGKIFEIHLRKVPEEKIVKGININKLAEMTKDCSGSDIKDICEEAIGIARRRREKVGMKHFEKVIEAYTRKNEGGEPGPYIG